MLHAIFWKQFKQIQTLLPRCNELPSTLFVFLRTGNQWPAACPDHSAKKRISPRERTEAPLGGRFRGGAARQSRSHPVKDSGASLDQSPGAGGAFWRAPGTIHGLGCFLRLPGARQVIAHELEQVFQIERLAQEVDVGRQVQPIAAHPAHDRGG